MANLEWGTGLWGTGTWAEKLPKLVWGVGNWNEKAWGNKVFTRLGMYGGPRGVRSNWIGFLSKAAEASPLVVVNGCLAASLPRMAGGLALAGARIEGGLAAAIPRYAGTIDTGDPTCS